MRRHELRIDCGCIGVQIGWNGLKSLVSGIHFA
jgi:hypothetical protein